MQDYISIAKEKLKNNIDLELVVILSSSGGAPRTTGAYMFVDSDAKSYGTVGGGTVEFKATLDARELLLKKENIEKPYNLTMEAAENLGMVCGGNVNLRFTYLTNDEKSFKIIDELDKKTSNKSIVYIFGAGHVSMELTNVLDYIGYKVVIWDNREDFANVNRFPNAKEIICGEFKDINKKINFTPDDFAVIMTRGHVSDYNCLTQVMRTNAGYIGMIGSSEKNKFVRDKAFSEGFTEVDFKNVHAPIGVQVGAETPEEIAISIACEIVLYKSKMENRRKYEAGKTLFDTCSDYKK